MHSRIHSVNSMGNCYPSCCIVDPSNRVTLLVAYFNKFIAATCLYFCAISVSTFSCQRLKQCCFAVTSSVESHLEEELHDEENQYKDIVILDTNDEFDTPSHKSMAFFREIPNEYPALFYCKAKHEASIDLQELATELKARQHEGNLYIGHMKSGPVS